MAGTFRTDFARIIALARVKLTEAKVEEEIDSTRAILNIDGRFAEYRGSSVRLGHQLADGTPTMC